MASRDTIRIQYVEKYLLQSNDAKMLESLLECLLEIILKLPSQLHVTVEFMMKQLEASPLKVQKTENKYQYLKGPVFRKLSNEDVDAILPRLQVMARSSPQDKYRLVKRLRELGEVVAVTGDGTNDAPQLKEGIQ